MRALQTARSEQKNALHGGSPEIWLVELYRDASNVVRYAIPCEEDITWNSLTWSKKGGLIEPPQADIAGGQQDMITTIGDADHTDVDRLAAGEYVDHKATVYLVNRANLADTSDYIKYRGVIVEANVEEGIATLVIGLYAFRYVVIPRCAMDRDRCSNDFKDARCGYTGVDTTCGKSIDDCDAKSNKARFRGFPGMLKFRP